MSGNRFDKGTPVVIERLGRCTLYHRKINGEFHQFKIRSGFVTVVGEPSYGNLEALDNLFKELKHKFKSILN